MFERIRAALVETTRRRLRSRRFWLTGVVIVPVLFGLALTESTMPVLFAAYVLWFVHELYDDRMAEDTSRDPRRGAPGSRGATRDLRPRKVRRRSRRGSIRRTHDRHARPTAYRERREDR